uniref:Uncharacterized protein n=1 Tax=Anguilla anguilla TaxID=7936 RepID=A0A0E9Q8V6_ANGAN
MHQGNAPALDVFHNRPCSAVCQIVSAFPLLFRDWQGE